MLPPPGRLAGRGRGRPSRRFLWLGSPALLRGLAGDAEPGADVGPGVAVAAEPDDGVADGVLDVGAEVSDEGEGFDVAACDAAGVGAQDAARERGVLVVLDDRPGGVWCQAVVDGVLALAAAGVRRHGGGPSCGAARRRPPGA